MTDRGKKPEKTFFVFGYLFVAFMLLLAWQGTSSAAENPGPSVRKAVFLSLLLPGTGELYAGDTRSAKSFFGAEALIWTVHLGLREHGRWRRQDYRAFATVYAGIDPAGKPDHYFNDIKFYESSYRFNEVAFQEDGPEARRYSPDAGWEWDNRESQQTYRSLRNSSLLSYRCASYMIGAAVANRIVSAINAARIARSSKQQAKSGESNRGIQLSCSWQPASGFILQLRW